MVKWGAAGPPAPGRQGRGARPRALLLSCSCAVAAVLLAQRLAAERSFASSAAFLALPADRQAQLPPRSRAQGAAALAAVDPSDCAGVRGEAVSGVLLPPMESDEPGWLSFMISRYLDDEWMEQPVHEKVGEAVGRLYRKSREDGDDDLIAVLAVLSYGLKDMWSQAGLEEAFEGPVDVANRAAEFLMLRLGRKVWSYGQSNSDVQQKMLDRLKEYEEARRAIREAVETDD